MRSRAGVKNCDMLCTDAWGGANWCSSHSAHATTTVARCCGHPAPIPAGHHSLQHQHSLCCLHHGVRRVRCVQDAFSISLSTCSRPTPFAGQPGLRAMICAQPPTPGASRRKGSSQPTHLHAARSPAASCCAERRGTMRLIDLSMRIDADARAGCRRSPAPTWTPPPRRTQGIPPRQRPTCQQQQEHHHHHHHHYYQQQQQP